MRTKFESIDNMKQIMLSCKEIADPDKKAEAIRLCQIEIRRREFQLASDMPGVMFRFDSYKEWFKSKSFLDPEEFEKTWRDCFDSNDELKPGVNLKTALKIGGL